MVTTHAGEYHHAGHANECTGSQKQEGLIACLRRRVVNLLACAGVPRLRERPVTPTVARDRSAQADNR